jgi:hypothetical protein|nr:MAG TPA: hypothetical protein [Caudoviricetes sp.]
MKKLVGAITGCIAAYYVMDTLTAASMACAWGDLVKYGHMQAAHELDDTFHKEYCKRDRKVFDFTKEVLLKEMERK